jgi:hypothetical protein
MMMISTDSLHCELQQEHANKQVSCEIHPTPALKENSCLLPLLQNSCSSALTSTYFPIFFLLSVSLSPNSSKIRNKKSQEP